MTTLDRLLEWALDLEHIHIGTDAPLLLKWGREVPAWVLLCFALVVLTHVALVYRRERTTVARRVILAGLRCAAMAAVAAVLCEPSLVLQRNRVESSHVALLLDTSASMGTRDYYSDESLRDAIARGAGLTSARGAGFTSAPGTDSLAGRSRLELLRSALLRDNAAALRRILEQNGLHLLTFAGAVEGRAYAQPLVDRRGADGDLETAGLGPVIDALNSTQPNGARTDLFGALAGLIGRSPQVSSKDTYPSGGRGPRDDRLAAVILMTDGQSTPPIATGANSADAPGQLGVPRRRGDALESFADRAIPVFPVLIGSAVPPRDIAVGPLRAASAVFIDDPIAIETQLTARGLTEPATVLVSLMRESGGRSGAGGAREAGAASTIVDTRSVTLGPDVTSVVVEFNIKPQGTGVAQYRVSVSPLPGERITDNNTDVVDVEVIDDRLRVLFVESYPRYEYRYLKNALLREKNMDLSVLLIEADEQFVQEGTEPIRRFPETPEELDRFDVVFFGDVDPRAGWITTAQMNMLLDFVGNQGGGFALIAGERSAPHRFLGTPLEKLIPVSIDPVARAASWSSAGTRRGTFDANLNVEERSDRSIGGAALNESFRPRLTPDGRQSNLFRFVADREQSERLFDALPELYWSARTLGPKPGATVLAEHPTMPTASGLMPLVVTGRYGAGRIFFQATDDTWRWRRHTGELLHDAYWVQVARELMRGVRVAQGRRFVLLTHRRILEYGAPVRTRVEIYDRQLLREQEDAVEVTVTRIDGLAGDAGSPDALEDRMESAGGDKRVVARFEVHRLGAGSSIFEGAFVPPGPGRFSLEAVELSARRGPDPIGDPTRRANRGVTIRVNRPDLETRRLEANHAVLERIASATGGRVVQLDELEEAFGRIRDRSVQIPDDVTEPLWDSKLVLAFFVSMISLEWGLRKLFGML